MTSKLYVLKSSGAVLTWTTIPSPPILNPKCGGPPMIGDAGGVVGTAIGVASCTRYTLFKYNPGVQTLTQVWSKPISDAGGQTTSTLYNSPTGPRVVYADESKIWVFNATNGAVVQSVAQNSATAIEGPVIASLDTGHPRADVSHGERKPDHRIEQHLGRDAEGRAHLQRSRHRDGGEAAGTSTRSTSRTSATATV